jgi:hypothetical protein
MTDAIHAVESRPVPAVFGYHELFEVLVIAAAALQYAAIALCVLPGARGLPDAPLGVLGRVGGGAHRGGHERRAGDHEAEREEAAADLDGAGADRLVEDQDAADDGGEVGGHRGERDDLDPLADLVAAGGGVEGDHAGDQRGQRPPAQRPQQRSRRRLGEVLDRDIGDPEQRARGRAEAALLARLEAVRDQLFRLAAGLDPLVLHEHGLGPALRELAQHAGMPVSVLVPAERFPPKVEMCVWFTCAEAVANALKHSGASRLEIAVRRRGDALQVEVSDDGVGGADPERGSGLRRLAERVQHAGGALAIRSPEDRGTRIVAELNLGESA